MGKKFKKIAYFIAGFFLGAVTVDLFIKIININIPFYFFIFLIAKDIYEDKFSFTLEKL